MSLTLPVIISVIYTFGLIVGITLSLFLAGMAWQRRREPGIAWFIMLGATSALVLIFYLLGAISEDIFFKLWLSYVRVPLIMLSMLFNLFAVVTYTGGLRISALAKLLLTLPVVLTVLVISAQPDSLFVSWWLVDYGILGVDLVRFGWWFWIHTAYTLLLGQILIVYLFWRIRREMGLRRTQVALLTVAALLMVIIPVVAIPLRDTLPLNLTPIGALVFIAILGWIVLHYRLLDTPYVFDTVFIHMQDGVIFINPSGQIAQINRAAARLVGQADPDALLMRPIASLPEVSALVSEGGEIRLTGVDGAARLVDMVISPAFNHQGQAIGKVLVLRDVTAQRQLQEALIEQAQLRTSLHKEQELSEIKTRMMIRIAHEFRTPLSVIQLNNDMMQRYSDRMNPEQRATRLKTIQQQVGSLSAMIGRIAMVLRGELHTVQPVRETLDFVALCREAILLLAEQFPDRPPITLDTPLAELTVCADRDLLALAIGNLLLNAAQFSPPDAPITCTLAADRSGATFTVQDRGIGIPASEQDRIFDPFFRGSNIGEIGGLGLGLGLARDALQVHHGTITIHSQAGQGTQAVVRLPILPC